MTVLSVPEGVTATADLCSGPATCWTPPSRPPPSIVTETIPDHDDGDPMRDDTDYVYKYRV